MVHAWGLAGEAAWNHPSWSISAEWFAYLSFPAFAAAAIALRGRPNLAVALAVMLLFGLYAGFQAVTGELLTQATVAWGALRIVPCFAYGCALFLLWRSGALETRMQAMAALAVSTALVGVSAQMGAPDAVTVTAAGGAIFALAGLWSHLPRGAFGGLTGRAAVYLGEVSYSVYMICIPWSLVFVNGAAKAFGLPEERLPLPLWLVFIAAVVPLAAVSHHLIERPARAWLRNLGTNHGKTALEPGLAR
jgi:peptidoglycan/LPS O-acetylase OafA/YrhL